MKSKFIRDLALYVVCAFASVHASATNLFDPTVSSTTIIDGSSVELNGTLNDLNGQSRPWTAELFAGTGECVRFFVTSTAFDSKLTIIAPNGWVYRDDDSGGLNRPLVKIASAPVTGWYTVQVAHYSGAPTSANFTLLYGRYTAGNVNCSGGTAPLSSGIAPEAHKSQTVAPVIAPKDLDAPQ